MQPRAICERRRCPPHRADRLSTTSASVRCSYVKGAGLGGGVVWLLRVQVGAQLCEHQACEAAFETAQGFGRGVTGVDAFAVVGLARTVDETDLGDGDAVQGGVELAVARAGHPNSASGVTRPD